MDNALLRSLYHTETRAAIEALRRMPFKLGQVKRSKCGNHCQAQLTWAMLLKCVRYEVQAPPGLSGPIGPSTS